MGIGTRSFSLLKMFVRPGIGRVRVGENIVITDRPDPPGNGDADCGQERQDCKGRRHAQLRPEETGERIGYKPARVG